MFCPKCGKQLPEAAKFCTACGAQMTASGSEKPVMKMKPQKPAQTPAVPPAMPDREDIGLRSDMEAVTQRDREMADKNKRTMLILLCVLLVLVLIAGGMAAYYFVVLKDNSTGKENVTAQSDEDNEQENMEEESDDTQQVDDKTETDPVLETGEADSREENLSEETAAAQADDQVVSDINEVVNDVILTNVPKALYSYDFEEELGGAQVVVRNAPEAMPEITNDVEAQYVTGIDGKAVYLDGTYGIRLSDVEKIGTSYSVAFWMKAEELYDWAPFIHIGYKLLDQTQRCRLWLGQKTDGAAISPILSSEHAGTGVSFEIRPNRVVYAMDPGVWYHIVFTVDGSVQGSNANSLYGSLYVAGQYAGGGDIALNTMNVDDFDVYLGINCWDVLYPAAFDGVKIWNQVLDADQVEELFNAYR